jgi:hypothetical protein
MFGVGIFGEKTTETAHSPATVRDFSRREIASPLSDFPEILAGLPAPAPA